MNRIWSRGVNNKLIFLGVEAIVDRSTGVYNGGGGGGGGVDKPWRMSLICIHSSSYYILRLPEENYINPSRLDPGREDQDVPLAHF